MIISGSKKEELKQSIRKLLLYNPNQSCIEIGNKLGISKNYSNKLINEVREENSLKIKTDIQNVSKTSVEEDYLKLEEKTKDLNSYLYGLIGNRSSSKSEKIKAAQTIFTMEKSLMDLKLHIGLYEKNNTSKNEMSVPEIVRLVKEVQRDEKCPSL